MKIYGVFFIIFLSTIYYASVARSQDIEKIDYDFYEEAEVYVLDKATGQREIFILKLGKSMVVHNLKLEFSECISMKAGAKIPESMLHIEVLDDADETIFDDWLLAYSLGYNQFEHPHYDIWLSKCIRKISDNKYEPTLD
ncbi:MAG: DUF2155 domain-containing protein [Alphaproteobacteria bacterium]|nr:DUF2155 domain-containing protein [Alphaproteobacteria bacterium]MBL0718203.1 DUF2155 domain-containing protein [Alphaproteobacteria bacterium]